MLADGFDGSDELAGEIKAFVRERLSAYAYPRRIEFVADLPKTLTGKIRRIELREREQAERPATRSRRCCFAVSLLTRLLDNQSFERAGLRLA